MKRVEKCFACGGLFSTDLMRNINIDGMDVRFCVKCYQEQTDQEDRMLMELGIPIVRPEGQEVQDE